MTSVLVPSEEELSRGESCWSLELCVSSEFTRDATHWSHMAQPQTPQNCSPCAPHSWQNDVPHHQKPALHAWQSCVPQRWQGGWKEGPPQQKHDGAR